MLSEQVAAERIETARLRLFPLGPGHARALFPLLADWEVARNLASLPWPLTRDDVETYARRSESAEAESDDFVVLHGDLVIGCASVKRPGTGTPPRVMPRLGYWIGGRYWGHGYATEAVAALTGYGLRVYDAARIGGGVFVDNPASRRVLEKLGFAETRRYRTACLARGEAVETADMQITREAFAEVSR